MTAIGPRTLLVATVLHALITQPMYTAVGVGPQLGGSDDALVDHAIRIADAVLDRMSHATAETRTPDPPESQTP